MVSFLHVMLVQSGHTKDELSSVRNRANHVSKAKSLIVAGLNVVAPRDTGYLWEVVRKKSGSVEKELGIGEQQEEKKIS